MQYIFVQKTHFKLTNNSDIFIQIEGDSKSELVMTVVLPSLDGPSFFEYLSKETYPNSKSAFQVAVNELKKYCAAKGLSVLSKNDMFGRTLLSLDEEDAILREYEII